MHKRTRKHRLKKNATKSPPDAHAISCALSPLTITKPHNLLPTYLHIIQRELPEVFQSIELMHSYVLANYSPSDLPARYRKDKILSCDRIAYPNALFDQPLGMQIVLMSHGYLHLYPFLRAVVLHNATVYLVANEQKASDTSECESLITDLLWMLFVDTSRIAAKWNGIAAEILGNPIFASSDTNCEGIIHQRDNAHSVFLCNNTPETAKAFQMLREKYKKRITEKMPPNSSAAPTSCPPNEKDMESFNVETVVHRIHTLASFLHSLPDKRINAYRELIQYGKRNGPMFIIAPSQIHNAGFGLYICGKLPENERISLYAGLFTSKKRINLGENSGYLLHYKKEINIDGGAIRNLGCMVNDYRDKTKEKKGKPNCRFACSARSHSIRTKRAVENEEMLIYYGLSYRIRAKDVHNVVSKLKKQALQDGGPIPIHPAAGILEELQS